MGHTRLGKIPTTKKWQQVVAIFSGGDGQELVPLTPDIQMIAAQSLEAAQRGLDKAVDDVGLRYTFYLLTQLVLASRESDWQRSLSLFNIQLTQDATILDLTVEFQGAIDDYLSVQGSSTDVSEIAQQAAGEAIISLIAPKTNSLFGPSQEDLRFALHGLSTKKGFSELGQRFFGRFMSRYLDFYLSRVTADQLGGSRLSQIGDISEFNWALQNHCNQSARIVRNYCGEWYSKTEFQRGIDIQNTSGFMAVAIRKLQSELKRQGAEI